MLRRLVHRFSEEGRAREGQTDADECPGGGISQKVVEEVELDVDSEEDETERWIMEVGGPGGGPTGGLARDAKASGRRVWVPDGDGDVWRKAEVLSESTDGASYTVLAKGGKDQVEVPVGECADYDPSHALDLADASRMNQMHEAPLLDLLRRRFEANNIYTNVADVLVSINPYTDIPGLYDIPMPVSKPISGLLPGLNVSVRGPSAGGTVAARSAALMREFKDGKHDHGGGRPGPGRGNRTPRGGSGKENDEPGTPKAQLTALKSMLGKPHVYGVADRAFKYMAETKGREVDGRVRHRNQSILITGESGAGKTEASKYVMRFLITASRALAGTAPAPSPRTPGASEGGRWRSPSPAAAAAAAAKHMEDVLLRSNTVLEAFGNAKTVRNDNSSRFGKYIKLQYDSDFRLVGARTEHFLLEKSRLVHLEDSERSYHILYQIAKALPPAERKEFHLAGGAERFSLLNQGNCLDASDDVDDHEEFGAVDKALSSLDFSAEEKTDMWRLLAAVLHSGEVRFEDVPGQEQCRMRKRRDAAGNNENLSPAALAALWGVDQSVFEAGVMRRTVTAGGTSASVALNAAQARENLLALLKHMYRQLFAWINWKINVVFDVPTASEGLGLGGAGAERTFIGILDIFGFEIMATNSFEQLCINFANEVLQRQFNHHIFVLEQEEYGAEGLDVASIPFRDNQRIIDLIAKRPAGLMPILEDQALTGRKAASLGPSSFTDKNLLELFHQQHHRRSPHPCYRKPRFDGPEFVIMHYAGEVTYCATGFLEKNNDTLQEDLRGLLLSSRIPFLRQLILGEDGDFWKEGGTTTTPTSSGSVSAAAPSRGGGAHRPRAPASGGGLPPPLTFSAPNAVSKRVSYGDGSGSGAGWISSAEADRAGGGGAGRSSLKRAASTSTRIAAKATVSNAFRSQLEDLVAQLGQTEPHYIKCIKPNVGKTPGGWTSPLVIEQLRYSGVLEVVRIRREAFPMRVSYKHFYRRFGNLLASQDVMTPAEDITSTKARDAGIQICNAVFGEPGGGQRSSFQMGKTKIFLRDDGLKRLRAALRLHYFCLAAKIQALWRGASARARLSRQRAAAGRMQRLARGNAARRRFHEIQQATRVLQAAARMRKAMALAKRREASAVKLQAIWRGWRQRGWEKRNASATRVQAAARGFVARKRREREAAATTLQAASRGRAARRQLAELRAKEEERKSAAVTCITAAWRGKSERLYGPGRRAAKLQAEKHLWALREAYLLEEEAASRVQRAVRAHQRNGRLRSRSIEIFSAARSGDVPSVARHVSEWPMLLFLRDRYDGGSARKDGDGEEKDGPPSYSTLLHAACEGGTVEVVALLEPFLSDITAVDRWGNTPVHVAAAGCEYELLKLLARRANLDVSKAVRAAANGHPAPRPEAFPVGLSREAFRLAAGMVRRLRLAEAAAPPTAGGGGAARHGGRAGKEEDARKEPEADDESGDDGDGVGSGGGGGGGGDERSVGSLRMGSWEGGEPVVEGFLKKRRETDRWLKRWCQLKRFSPSDGRAGDTGPALFYFKKKTDDMPSKIIMLHHCLLKKSEALDFAFELHSPLMMEGKNKEGRLYFQAGNEVELQKWLVALRTLVKFYDFINEKRQVPMEYLDQGRRESLVQAKNDLGETPLHLAVAFAGAASRSGRGSREAAAGGGGGGGARGGKKRAAGIAVQRLAAWLIENGASPNACDNQGETPMHRVVQAGHADAAAALQKYRGNVNLPRRTDWKTPADLATGSGEVWQRLRKEAAVAAPKGTVGIFADATPSPTTAAGAAAAAATAAAPAPLPLLPPPAKLPGFTYVSVFFEAFSVASSTAGMDKPFLTLSVFSARGELVEAAQDIDSPALKTSKSLWWGRTWHMQTPLETLGSGSTMVFELRDLQGDNKKAICWGALPLDPDHLNTQPEQLSTYLAPTDPVRLMKARDVHSSSSCSSASSWTGCYGGGRGGGNGGSSSSSLPLHTDAELGADVCLTRC